MIGDDLALARRQLLDLLRARAFQRREVTLASGKKSSFYLDCKEVTLDAIGALLVGRLLFEQVRAYQKRTGHTIRGVGGLTLGADPIASAVSMTSALLGAPIPAFIVRKEPKKHGTEAYLEGLGNIPAGSEVVVVEDVVTSGESSAKAVTRVRAAGLSVRSVLAIVDRLEGGHDYLALEQIELVSLFDRRDFLDETPS